MAIVLRVLTFCCSRRVACQAPLHFYQKKKGQAILGPFFFTFPSFGEVEFHQKLIGAIVNLPIPKWRTIMGLFLLEKGYLYQNGVEFHQKVIGALSTCLPLHGEQLGA